MAVVPLTDPAISPESCRKLQGSFATLVVANPDGFVDLRKENLAVADLASTRSCENRLNRFLHHRVSEHHFQLRLWNQINAVLAAAVHLSMSLLTTVNAHFKHGHSFDADLLQRRLYGFQLGILYDCFHLRHSLRKSCSASTNAAVPPERSLG